MSLHVVIFPDGWIDVRVWHTITAGFLLIGGGPQPIKPQCYSATSIDELWNNCWPGLSTSECWQSNGKGFLSQLRQLWSIWWWLVIFNGDSWSLVDIQTSGWYIYLSYTTTLKCYPLVVIDLCTFPYNLTHWRRNHKLKWMELYPNFISRC